MVLKYYALKKEHTFEVSLLCIGLLTDKSVENGVSNKSSISGISYFFGHKIEIKLIPVTVLSQVEVAPCIFLGPCFWKPYLVNS